MELSDNLNINGGVAVDIMLKILLYGLALITEL